MPINTHHENGKVKAIVGIHQHITPAESSLCKVHDVYWYIIKHTHMINFIPTHITFTKIIKYIVLTIQVYTAAAESLLYPHL